jgi:hypothetical protein
VNSSRVRTLGSLFSVVVLGGCMMRPPPRPKSVMEIRQIQTRLFETKDSRAVQKAVFDVLQDDDYIVKNADMDFGLITAVKERSLNSGRGVSAGFGFGLPGSPFALSSNQQVWPAAEIYEVTVNVTPERDRTKVRLNVQRRVTNNINGVVESQLLEDPKFYQDFFARVDKGLYLQREGL